MYTEEEAKRELGISDFRHMTKDMVLELLSKHNDIDPQLRLAIEKNFPEVARMINTTGDQIASFASKAIEENSDSNRSAQDGYQAVIDAAVRRVDDPATSPEDKRYFEDKAMEAADKKAAKDSENKGFLIEILKAVGTAAVMVVGIVLGNKFLGGGGGSGKS